MMCLNERDLDVIRILCIAGEPLTCSDVVSRMSGLTHSTVTSVMRKLLKMEIVEVAGVTHVGSVLSRTYIPGPECKRYCYMFLQEAYEFVSPVINVPDFVELLYSDLSDDK